MIKVEWEQTCKVKFDPTQLELLVEEAIKHLNVLQIKLNITKRNLCSSIKKLNQENKGNSGEIKKKVVRPEACNVRKILIITSCWQNQKHKAALDQRLPSITWEVRQCPKQLVSAESFSASWLDQTMYLPIRPKIAFKTSESKPKLSWLVRRHASICLNFFFCHSQFIDWKSNCNFFHCCCVSWWKWLQPLFVMPFAPALPTFYV